MFEVMDPNAVDLKLNGTRFKKEIVKFGTFRHPNPKFTKDPKYNWTFGPEEAQKLIENYKAGAVESVKLIDAHDEEKAKRLGAVVDLVKTDTGVEAVIEVEDQNALQEIQARTSDGKPLAHGVSSGLDFGFPNSDANKPGTWEGPVLRHVALVSIPWIQGMKDWEKVEEQIAASTTKMNFGHENYSGTPMVLADESKKDDSKTVDLASQLSDVLSVLNSMAHKLDEKPEEKTKKDDDTNEGDKMTSEQIAAEVQKALGPILNSIAPLTEKLQTANTAIEEDQKRRLNDAADEAVKKLLSAGKILPKDKDTYKQIYLSSGKEMFDQIANTLPVQVSFDETDVTDDPFESNPYKKELSNEELTTEVERYIKLMTPSVAGRADNISTKGGN